MFFQDVEDTECPECGGTLGWVGFKEEANGWKAYCDCGDCEREFGSTYISYSDVDHEDEKIEQAEKHVKRISVA